MCKSADPLPVPDGFRQLELQYCSERRALWYHLKPFERPCFNRELLQELRRFQQDVTRVNQAALAAGQPVPVRYTILASRCEGVFNLGGDLALFAELIRQGNRATLLDYATACIDVLYPNAVGFDQPVTTMTLVQGDALAGGFEAAISSHVVIAERQARFGLPEVLFNLIPGMGAFTFLSRRVSPEVAERLILGGDLISADHMHELGLVDVVVGPGRGPEAVDHYLAQHHKRHNAHAALRRVRQLVNPITYEELLAVTTIWVDAALQLSSRDLRVIERIVAAQDRQRQRQARAASA